MFRCRACWTCFMRNEQIPTHSRDICNNCHSLNLKSVDELELMETKQIKFPELMEQIIKFTK